MSENNGEVIVKAFKEFTTEVDYNNALKSVSNAAKGELLKEAGAKSVEEIKGWATQASELEATKAQLSLKEKELQAQNYKLEALKQKCKPEHLDNVIILATAKPKEGKTVEESIALYIDELGVKEQAPAVKEDKGRQVDPEVPPVGATQGATAQAERDKEALAKQMSELQKL